MLSIAKREYLGMLAPIKWTEIATLEYVKLLDNKSEEEAQEYFDSDIQAGLFSCVRKEKREAFLTYLFQNNHRFKLNRNANMKIRKLLIERKIYRIDESSTLQEFTVEPSAVYPDEIGILNTEFKCITGELIKCNSVNVEIDPSLGDRVVVTYLIPKWTYEYVAYWNQTKKKEIVQYDEKNIHGVRLKMSSIRHHNLFYM